VAAFLAATAVLAGCDAGGAGGPTNAGGAGGGGSFDSGATSRPDAGGIGGAGGGGAAGAGGSAPDASPASDVGASPQPDSGAADAVSACTEGLLLCSPLSPLPRTIKETGLFLAPPDFGKRPERVRLYKPDPELFSDGLHKLRYALLPAGQKIDNTDPKEWDFPIGMIFVKTFLDDGPAGTQHPVETRIVRRKDMFEYEYAAYRWNAAGTEAELADNKGITRVPVPATLQGRGAFTHQIPAQQDCEECHEGNRKRHTASVIGFDEIRLNSRLDAQAPRTQLQEFAALGFFKAPLPATPTEIVNANAGLQRVMRFIYGNCAHCHHGEGTFDMRPDVFVENTVGKPTEASGVTPPPGYLRVVRRNPERSVLYLQARGTNLMQIDPSLRVMPPVGVSFPPGFPAADLEAIRSWINAL
jgi:hypothetical protein